MALDKITRIKTYTFCAPFIEQLADDLVANHLRDGADFERVAVVFGGKRPGLFLRRALARRLKRTYIPPRIWTIDEFIHTTANARTVLRAGSEMDHAYLIYRLAHRLTPSVVKGRERFSQFLPWAREILAFIDQLDLEQINEKALRGIESNAAIGYEVPEDINRLLGSIMTLRQAFHKHLYESGQTSRGLQYLRAAENISTVPYAEYDHIIFANFFYFNRSEEAVVKEIHRRGQGLFMFQGDERKWPVLSRLARRFQTALHEGPTVDEPHFDLKLHAGFDVHSQIATVREILKTIDQPERAVIVLPNPDHIIPLLSEIAGVVKDFNISMGYPLKRSSLYSLLECVFQSQISRKGSRYYARDYLRAIRHPFIKNLHLFEDATVTRILIHKIEEVLTGQRVGEISGMLFVELGDVEGCEAVFEAAREMLVGTGVTVTRADLEKILRTVHQVLFARWELVATMGGFAESLKTFLDLIVEKSFLRRYPLNINIASKMYALAEEFEAVEFHREPFEQAEIFSIFQTRIRNEIVAFSGSPLKGLQLLGLFETRSLNFEHVIVLDTNEGVLPKLNIYEPLIPREVMISLNLDRLELEEEIQRYQFMRLISSARNVHLVYQEGKDKEPSRFVEELIWEKQKQDLNDAALTIHRPGFQIKVQNKIRVVPKSPDMCAYLRERAFSASSLNLYLRNPMEFYVSYVLGLREQEDVLDEPDARQIGIFLHDFLEEAFVPFLGKRPVLDEAFRRHCQELFEERFDASFGRSMKSDAFLIKEVLVERIARFMKNEATDPKRRVEEILALEHRYSGEIPLSGGNIAFQYIVDRIDRMTNKTVMILDYKTGHVDQLPRNLRALKQKELSRELIREHIPSFQIPLYLYFLRQQFPGQAVDAALYSLRTLEVKAFGDRKDRLEWEETQEIFLRALDFIIAEILSPDVPFEEDPLAVTKAWR